MSTQPGLTPKQIVALEALFAAEVETAVSKLFAFPDEEKTPPQIMRQLRSKDMAELKKFKIPGDRKLRIPSRTYYVWFLTLRGNMAYCDWAATQPSEEGEPA